MNKKPLQSFYRNILIGQISNFFKKIKEKRKKKKVVVRALFNGTLNWTMYEKMGLYSSSWLDFR